MSRIRKHIIRPRTLIILVILVLVVLFGIRNATSTTVAKKLTATSIVSVDKRTVTKVVSDEGNLNIKDQRELSLLTAAEVKEIDVSLGQLVKKDDVLGIVTTSTAGRKQDVKIKSPIDGFVSAINYEAKETVVNATIPGFIVTPTGPLRIEANVNENDIVELTTGLKADITVPAISLVDKYPATLAEIYPAPVNGTSTVSYKVVLEPTSLPPQARIGMSVDIDIVTAQVADVLAIPESYLIDKDDKHYVKVIKWKDADKQDYELEETEVQIGLRTDEYVEIKSGVNIGTELAEPSFVIERQFSFLGG